MASSTLLPSAGRLLRRPITQVSLHRIPRAFLSNVTGWDPPCKVHGFACERIQSLIEKGIRYERRQELHVKISFVLLPSVAAVFIFGPEPKRK